MSKTRKTPSPVQRRALQLLVAEGALRRLGNRFVVGPNRGGHSISWTTAMQLVLHRWAFVTDLGCGGLEPTPRGRAAVDLVQSGQRRAA
jgi:hypothetical protein